MYTPDVVIIILSLDVIVVVVVVTAATVVVILLLDIVVILISGNGVAIVVLFFGVMEAIPTPDVMYSYNIMRPLHYKPDVVIVILSLDVTGLGDVLLIGVMITKLKSGI